MSALIYTLNSSCLGYSSFHPVKHSFPYNSARQWTAKSQIWTTLISMEFASDHCQLLQKIIFRKSLYFIFE